MKKENDSEQFVDRVMDSLDGIGRAQPQPWLYTRISARLRGEIRTGWELVSQFLSRPAIAMSTLCLVLVLNAFFLLRSDEPANVAVQNDVTESESLIASSSSFEFENITP